MKLTHGYLIIFEPSGVGSRLKPFERKVVFIECGFHAKKGALEYLISEYEKFGVVIEIIDVKWI